MHNYASIFCIIIDFMQKISVLYIFMIFYAFVFCHFNQNTRHSHAGYRLFLLIAGHL